MQKELNPELFGESQTKSRVFEPAPTKDMSLMEQKVSETRNQVYQISENLNKIVGQINEFIKSSQIKFDRMNQQIQRLEQNDAAISQDAGQKISQLHARIADKKTTDAKIQEMIDRHNNILRSFEVRLAQMQKIMSEKEAQAIAAQAALNEAKMEIARLKRF